MRLVLLWYVKFKVVQFRINELAQAEDGGNIMHKNCSIGMFCVIRRIFSQINACIMNLNSPNKTQTANLLKKFCENKAQNTG